MTPSRRRYHAPAIRPTAAPPQPLRIVVLIDLVGEAGGAETLAVELLLRLDRRRFTPTLITYRYFPPGTPEREGEDRVVRRLQEAGIEVVQLDGVTRWDLGCWRPLLARLHHGDVDVLHTHKHGPNLWGALLSRLRSPGVLVAHEHTWSFTGQRVRVLTDRWLMSTRADAVLAVSDADRAKMIAVEGIPAQRVRVLPNGIPKPEKVPGRGLREEFELPEGAPLVGSVGVLRRQKDFPTLVEAHRRVLARRPDARLVIVGEGEQRAELEELVARHNLGGRVFLAGMRPHGAALVREFDVAVNSSTFEGSSLAVIEYMAAGRAIVATAVGGSSELLAHGEAGVLVAPSDPGELADAILGLIDDPARAATLGAAAARRQAADFDIDRQVERLQDLYEELHAARAGAANR